jgi:hypothetical protein
MGWSTSVSIDSSFWMYSNIFSSSDGSCFTTSFCIYKLTYGSWCMTGWVSLSNDINTGLCCFCVVSVIGINTGLCTGWIVFWYNNRKQSVASVNSTFSALDDDR